MSQFNIDEIEKRTLSGLKDFQRATVERVDYLFRHNQNRVLVADEVGMGKTLIARGAIVKTARLRIEEKDDLFKVIYICSNQNIANQNIRKLDVTGKNTIGSVSDTRLSMQHLKITEQENDPQIKEGFIQLIPLTPETSFRMTTGGGSVQERALMYAILRRMPDFKGHATSLEKFMIMDAVKAWDGWAKWNFENRVAECEKMTKGVYPQNVIEKILNYQEYESIRDLLLNHLHERRYNKQLTYSKYYSENILVQESAGHLLVDELGWQVELAYNQEVLGENGTFGRSSYKDILLVRYFQKALRTLNPWITDAQVTEAQNTFEKHLSSASLMQINEEKYAYIRDGIPVTEKKPNGQTEEKRAIIIDFQHPNDMERNHFLAVKEMKIHGDLYRRRTDIVGFVNGIPLLFIELKKNSVDVQNAYTDNYTDYLDTIPQLFYYNAFLMLSNGVEAKVATLGSKYEFFHEWKRLSEQEQGSVALETMLRGICKKENFLDLLENFILFDHSGGKTVKILARNHQYLGVNEAVKAYEARKLNNGKLGVFWHTQGSGKSYSMVFLSQKIRRKFAGSPTIVVLTDREELNTQISDTFENCGLLGKTKASKFIATSGEDLINKLKGNPSFIFTLIQKFNKKVDEPIIPDHDIIIMSDEAHRSQYGVFADNMVELLPTASRIGFTGTPLLSNDNITERTFGGYISIYDFKRAVEDKATVPLYYENRGEKILDINNPDITDKILDAIEAADLDPEQEEKLEHEFEKEIHLLTAEPRLKSVARDFVSHYSDLWTSGKAMFVCLDRQAGD